MTPHPRTSAHARELMARPPDGSVPHLRIARSTGSIEDARRFWVEGVGLDVLLEVNGSGHHLLMLGWADAGWHLELVLDADVARTPTDEDLLVLYLTDDADDRLVEQLVVQGGRRVRARNPYWDERGVTIEDPDGYRLVLCRRSWLE